MARLMNNCITWLTKGIKSNIHEVGEESPEKFIGAGVRVVVPLHV